MKKTMVGRRSESVNPKTVFFKKKKRESTTNAFHDSVGE